MTLVATLVCNPSGPCLTDALVNAAAQALDAQSVNWLDHGIAADILFTGDIAARAALAEHARKALCCD
jgi:hypothetical protein